MTATPRRTRAGSAGTLIVLIVCALVAAAAVTAAALLPDYARDTARRDADAALRAFLDAATAGDEDWRDAASPMLQALVTAGAPLRGDPGAAEALSLDVDYEVVQLTLRGGSPETSDTASAGVIVRYRYSVQGEKGTATVPQTVWLTRPFYYGDDVPRQADPKREPSAVGPWRVTGSTVPTARDLAGAAPRSRLGLRADASDRDDRSCYSAEQALIEIADRARIDGELSSSCFLGVPDGSEVIAADVDRSALLEAFPAIDETDPSSIPPELMRIAPDTFHGMRAPFTQYLVEDFVLTFAAVRTSDDESAARLVSIRPAEGEK